MGLNECTGYISDCFQTPLQNARGTLYSKDTALDRHWVTIVVRKIWLQWACHFLFFFLITEHSNACVTLHSDLHGTWKCYLLHHFVRKQKAASASPSGSFRNPVVEVKEPDSCTIFMWTFPWWHVFLTFGNSFFPPPTLCICPVPRFLH